MVNVSLKNSAKTAKTNGDRYYFTGKSCKNGHVSKRLVSTRVCVTCNQETYKNDKENVINKSKERYKRLKKQDLDFSKKQYAKTRETHKVYREKNREIRNTQHREWYLKNHNHVLAYAKNYRKSIPLEEKRAQARKNYKNNKPTFIANVAKGRAAKLKRTPAWLTESDKLEMRLIYKIAARVSKETGVKYHVDHEIPLQGETVCGLHVPDNLQLLTASKNLSKSNTFNEVNI